ncbi:FecR domain-containing protein [Methylophilaceae bacterium]|nr:FecR domain-containing protein [Methylophilaceae bacterium]
MRIVQILLLLVSLSLNAFAEVAGVISLATKDVTIVATDGSKRQAKTGDNFNQGESILTPAGGKTQLLFKDQMTINLSQDSELKVDEFIFSNVEAADNKLTTSIKKGAFKFISGKISDKNKDAMKVKTPKTQIAIRGTGVVGDIEPDEENIILLDGAIEVSSEQTGSSQLLTQSGLGVNVNQAGAISAPISFDPASIDAVFQKVSLTEIKPATQSAEAQSLVSSLSKTMLDDDENELAKAIGSENATQVAEGLLAAADQVIDQSGNASNVSVGEVFTLFANQNAELVSKITGDENFDLTSLDNVVVSGNIFLYMAAGYSQPTGSTVSDFAAGRTGIITRTFDDIRLGGEDGGASAGSSGNMTASVQINTDASFGDIDVFRVNTTGSATLNGDTYDLTKDSGWTTGYPNGSLIAFDISTDTMREVVFLDQYNQDNIPSLDSSLNPSSYTSLILGSTLGRSAELQVQFTAGPFEGTGTDYSSIDAFLTDYTDPGGPGSDRRYINGIQQILD